MEDDRGREPCPNGCGRMVMPGSGATQHAKKCPLARPPSDERVERVRALAESKLNAIKTSVGRLVLVRDDLATGDADKDDEVRAAIDRLSQSLDAYVEIREALR